MPPTPAEIEAAKRQSVGQLLFACARLWNEEAIARVQARSGLPVRVAHTRLFPYIPFEGAPAAAIARRAGISKQAVGKLLDDLEAMGVVERVPDPADRRAQRVRWTDRGREGILHGLGVLAGLEQELAGELGPGRMDALRGLLADLAVRLAARAG